MTDTTDAVDIVDIHPVIPKNWSLLTAISMATPIVDPGHHPNEPGTIWGPPLNHIGLSGIGKSVRLKKLVRAMGLPGVHVVFVSTKQPADFTGAAVPTPDGIIIECILPAARKCLQAGGGVIFFDEVNGATPRTQMALLSSLNDRQFGDHVVPPATRMMCAMNPQEHSAGGFALSAPMANRMGHIFYQQPSKDEWARWLNGMQDEVPDLRQAEERVKQYWDNAWRVANALMQGFIRRVGEDVLVCQPGPDDPQSSGAWPSYRMWHWALCAIATCRALGYGDEQQFDFVHAFCGSAASVQWAKWIAEADLPDPYDMLTKGWLPDENRVDRSYAALTSMTDYLVNMKKEKPMDALQLAERGWKVLERTLDTTIMDLTANCAAKLHRNQLGRKGHTSKSLELAAEPIIFRLTNAGLTALADA